MNDAIQVDRDEYQLLSIAAEVVDRILRGHGRGSTVIAWAMSTDHVVTYPDGTVDVGVRIPPESTGLFRQIVNRMFREVMQSRGIIH